MTNLFKEREKICHENRKMLLHNVSSVKFLLSGGKADTPDQDLTINKLFLRDKDLGKNCAELLVKQARYQVKFFLEKMMEKANVNSTLDFLWNEIGADVIENNGIACISLNKGESVINCESFVNLTDELLKVTGFDELQLINRNVCREVDDASDIILSVPTLNEDLSISKPLCTENSERDDTERNEGGVVDEQSHSSEYDIFRDAAPISEKETTTTDEGSIGFDESLLKNFTFTVDAINETESYEPAVLCKFTTECTEPQDVHVFDVDKDPDWNAIGLPLLEKCVVFFDMKNNKCLLRKHEDVIIEETEEGRKISIVEKRVTRVSLARSCQRRGAVKQKAK